MARDYYFHTNDTATLIGQHPRTIARHRKCGILKARKDRVSGWYWLHPLGSISEAMKEADSDGPVSINGLRLKRGMQPLTIEQAAELCGIGEIEDGDICVQMQPLWTRSRNKAKN